MDKCMELTESQEMWNRLVTMMLIWERARNKELGKIGINMVQAEVLHTLKMSRESVTPTKLGRMMHRRPHTMLALLGRMETQGLVAMRKDLKRKNQIRVSLTKKGEAALRRWSTATEVPDALSCLSKKETEALQTIIGKLHNKGLELLRKMRPDPYGEPLPF